MGALELGSNFLPVRLREARVGLSPIDRDKERRRAGAMAQWIEPVLCKRGDQSSNPQHPSKG